MRSRIALVLAAAVLLSLLAAGGAPARTIWAKGNTHTHTTNSDGDSDPQVVADWYKSHGYQFLFITDHAKVTDPGPYDAPGDDFILIPGEESAVKGAAKPIHACALGLSRTIPYTENAATPAESIVKLVREIREAGALPQVNHPNYKWSFGYYELKGLAGPYLLEIHNAHPNSRNSGSEAVMPVEQVWDCLLSDGVTVYATATDDAHAFKVTAADKANPGRGWVYARVNDLTAENVLAALASGDFYASTGVELADYSFDGQRFDVRVKAKDGMKYWVRFVGKYGRILQETRGASASWSAIGRPEANDYVRCKVIADDGTVAWTQAFRLGR